MSVSSSYNFSPLSQNLSITNPTPTHTLKNSSGKMSAKVHPLPSTPELETTKLVANQQFGAIETRNRNSTSGSMSLLNVEVRQIGARRCSVFTTDNGQFIVEHRKGTTVKLPDNAKDQIVAWKRNPKTWVNQPSNDVGVEEKRLVRLNNRVSYEESDISPALNQFKIRYGCSWHKMRDAEPPASQKTLQIINDFRSANLEKHLATVRVNHSNIIDIKDFGSDKLTSDRDLAFVADPRVNTQTEEAKAVSAFNKEFEKEWGGPSADIFDINGYTMQYLQSAVDPELEQKRSKLQQEASLLIKYRTGTPENWTSFKEQTLNKIQDPRTRSIKSQEFLKIEMKSKQLDFKLNREICRLSLDSDSLKTAQKKDPTHLGNFQDLERILNEGADKATENDMNIVKAFANALKAEDSPIEIKASNKLHEDFKTSFGRLETERAALVGNLKKLGLINNPKEFSRVFNNAVDKLIDEVKTEIIEETDPKKLEELIDQLDDLKNARISTSLIPFKITDDQQRTMATFKAKNELDDKLKEAKEKLSQTDKLNGLLKKMGQLNNELIKMEGPPKLPSEIKKLNDQLTNIKSEIHSVAAKLDLNFTPHDLISNQQGFPADLTIKEKRAIEVKNLEIIQSNILASKNDPYWQKVELLSLEADRMLLEMQAANLNGMQFAQEAHASEGAVAVVVFNIQAGSNEVRSLNHYMQSLREISGYFAGHQEHQTLSYGKMIEGSKYADRLVVVSKFLIDRANTIGVQLPQISTGLKKLESFFKTLTPLRGTGKRGEVLQEAVRNAANESGFLNEVNNLAGNLYDQIATQVNKEVIELTSTWEAWISSVSFQRANE